MEDHRAASRRCHACNILVEDGHRNKGYMMSAFYEYESVVEYIESLPKGATFSRPSVWRALGKGYSLYTYVTYALYDMRLHGIIICSKVCKNNSCREYRVNDELRPAIRSGSAPGFEPWADAT